MNSQLFSVSASCTEHKNCVFEGQDMPIAIVMKNLSPYDIEVPLQYMQAKWPYMTLKDTETQEEMVLKTGMPPLSLKNIFKTIKPGESVSITSIIKAQEITQFRTKLINLTALIGLSAKIKVHDLMKFPDRNFEVSDFKANVSLKIIGKDTL